MIDDKRGDEALPTDRQSRQTAAIVGPGSIGGTIAAWLAASDAISVTLCVRTPFDRLVVETPTTRLDVAPRQISRPDAAQPVDWVLIATKTYDVAGTAAWLAQLVGRETRVAVLQNGVEHVRRFADHVPSDRLLPVMVDIPAERDAPGRIRQRRRGTMEVPAGSAGHAFAALFERAEIDVSESSDFVTAIWQKLCVNSAGAVSVLSNEPGGVARREPAAEIMRALIRECIAVGRAEGAVLDDSLIESVVQRYRDAPADSVNSMLADRRASRPMEWDARNGVVGRLGKKHGIATPVSDTVAGLLATIDESARSKR
ncbi:2-dehydropantoate 2-reductase [Sphingomonas asaccharolytica]|uniref:2-dehydropantoate 2-reductase n=1 Tax=Sphingomonas asaccharolytica TaxID=40681 RepID=UPI000A938983|nr:2-dehydropantoate 2-reductase [Sphingomonas asaccharolytica]